MRSFWESSYWFDHFDYTIIGCGIVGLTTAINLKTKDPSKSILLIEKGSLPQGASTKNAGFACFGTVGETLDDLESISQSDVIEVVKSRWNGLQALLESVPKSKIDYKQLGGTEVFLNKAEYDFCYDKLSAVNEIFESAIGLKNIISSVDSSKSKFYKYSLFNSLEGQLNPVLLIKYLLSKALKLGVIVNFGIEVTECLNEEGRFKLKTKSEIEIFSTHLILCTNAFTNQIINESDIVPVRNQVLVTKPLNSLAFEGTFHYDKGYVYFRNVGNNRLLIGGARNIDSTKEKTFEFGKNKKILDHLKEFSSEYILGEELKVEQIWSGIIASGSNKNPIVKEVEKNLFIGVRLGGMGVAIGTSVAQKLSKLVIEQTY